MKLAFGSLEDYEFFKSLDLRLKSHPVKKPSVLQRKSGDVKLLKILKIFSRKGKP